METFILIITRVEPRDSRRVSNSAILFSSFLEALYFARKDAKDEKYLASTYVEHIGDNKCHAEIKLYGKYINKRYYISNMAKGGLCAPKHLKNRLNTYCTYDLYDGENLF